MVGECHVSHVASVRQIFPVSEVKFLQSNASLTLAYTEERPWNVHRKIGITEISDLQ